MDGIFKRYKLKYVGTARRFLGLDYGDARVGVAVSDVERRIASPLAVLGNGSHKELIPRIVRMAAENDVALVVLGLPLEMSGREGAMAAKVRVFAGKLAATLPDVEIAFVDERLTSKMAERSLAHDFGLSRARRGQVVDKVAAAHILQRALDMMAAS